MDRKVGQGMKIKTWALLLILLCQASMPVLAQDSEQVPENYNAETMMKLCKGEAEEDPDLQSLICTFRIQGVSVMASENCWSILDGHSPLSDLAASPPPSRGAARQAFLNFMEENPQVWDLPWHKAVALSLSTTFPCENQ